MVKSKLLLTLVVGAILISCSRGPRLMSNISGKVGEVVVVINKGDWESDPGISLRSILAADYPGLPQREPLFTLINIPENAFSSIFQTHRNIVIVKIVPDLKEAKIIYQENVWSAPQIVVTISAPTALAAADIINKEGTGLSDAILQAERDRIIQNSKRYEDKSLRITTTRIFGGSPYFPKGYNLRKRASDFIWISYETTYTNQGIFLYKYPYTDSTDFELESLINKRNEFMYRNVPGPLDNTYMTTNLLTDPSMRIAHSNKLNFIEIRGLWEVQNDFMGGPFVQHVFLDKTRQNIIVIEAFVYAPRYDKRNYLRQVESIIYSFEFF